LNELGNFFCALVVDELPSVYLQKFDNVIATTRSNKVAVVLGLHDINELQELEGKETAATISSIMGSVR
jgi:type IV secretory pathway TraG/TraD family ATPase VirD4